MWRRHSGSARVAATNLGHCWPLLVKVLSQYSTNDRVVEKTGRAIKQALQSSRTSSAAMLPHVVETVVQQFQQSRHPCMLYIASELLKTYGADQQFQAPLGEAPVMCGIIFIHACGEVVTTQASGVDLSTLVISLCARMLALHSLSTACLKLLDVEQQSALACIAGLCVVAKPGCLYSQHADRQLRPCIWLVLLTRQSALTACTEATLHGLRHPV